ncbi:unnamed protein product [Allacma fusca]|uniref:Uncharacterized protein n=1 Tax=Allacma fusca TaxID=39272 RepID=A0A8J2L6V2_9HEXA|nr:unnamed protein product [Allacma fusca]
MSVHLYLPERKFPWCGPRHITPPIFGTTGKFPLRVGLPITPNIMDLNPHLCMLNDGILAWKEPICSNKQEKASTTNRPSRQWGARRLYISDESVSNEKTPRLNV